MLGRWRCGDLRRHHDDLFVVLLAGDHVRVKVREGWANKAQSLRALFGIDGKEGEAANSLAPILDGLEFFTAIGQIAKLTKEDGFGREVLDGVYG